MDIYKVSMEYTRLSFAILNDVGRKEAGLRDQLKRASMSISLNVAEGVGKVSRADQARFFAIARGSAMECAAILNIVELIRGNTREVAQARVLLKRIVEMLTKLCR